MSSVAARSFGVSASIMRPTSLYLKTPPLAHSTTSLMACFLVVATRRAAVRNSLRSWLNPGSAADPLPLLGAGEEGVPQACGLAQGIGDDLGWHTFRSLLDEIGAPLEVQQELMRHASIQTTMNVYGKATSKAKREANSGVAQLILPEVIGEEQPPEMEQGLLPAPASYVN